MTKVLYEADNPENKILAIIGIGEELGNPEIIESEYNEVLSILNIKRTSELDSKVKEKKNLSFL